MISAGMNYEKTFATAEGKRIAYDGTGEGDPIVLLHGNPTSSYLWRNVIPELEGSGRVIVPDLIGQGDSQKLPAGEDGERYGFLTACKYLSGLLESLGINERVTLFIHDWGSALDFHWAKNHPDAVRGIAYMEAIVSPVSWADWPEQARGIFQGFRSPRCEELFGWSTPR
jgi:haloalkane dehalogenase